MDLAAQSTPGALETLLRRDRLVVGAGLAAVTALAWVDLLRMGTGAGSMSRECMAEMAGIHPWSAADFTMMLWMWIVMMVAMMLPSAAPMILLFASVHRRARAEGSPFVPVAVFAAGYAIAWIAFSVVATLLQWGLDRAALLSPAMASASPWLGASLLIVAGGYQLSPWKDACLRQCRSPLAFLTTRWRAGGRGALHMGIEHGAVCVGCCWAIMGLLFVGGVMSFLTIVTISFFVLLEKVAPAWRVRGRLRGGTLSGVGLMVAGVVLLVTL